MLLTYTLLFTDLVMGAFTLARCEIGMGPKTHTYDVINCTGKAFPDMHADANALNIIR